MAEEINFMDTYMPSRSAQVLQLTTQAISNLTNPELCGLDDAIDKYTQLRDHLASLESRVYTLFNVKDMFELNRKITDFTNGIAKLNAMSDQMISKNNEIDILNPIGSKQYATIIENFVSKTITQAITEKDIENWLRIEYEGIGKKLKFGSVYLPSAIFQNIMGNHVSITDTQKKDLKAIFQMENAKQQKNSLTIPVEIEDTSIQSTEYLGFKSGKQDPIAQYGLTKIQDSLYDNLKKGVDTNLTTYLYDAIKRFPPGDLIIPKEIGNIRGLIGEISMDMLILYLFHGTIPSEVQALQGGGMRNALNNNAKIGIDYFLNQCGFQVKNYSILGSKFTSHIHLKLNNKLNTWAEKMNLQGEVEESFKLIWAMYNYNVPTKEVRNSSTINYDQIYNTVKQGIESTKTLFIVHPDSILRIGEDIQAAGLENGTYYNTFFYVSNQFLVPSSFIIDNFITYMKRLKQKSITQFDTNLTLAKGEYHGPKYKRGQRVEAIARRSTVYEATSIEAGYNLPLADFINDRVKAYQGG